MFDWFFMSVFNHLEDILLDLIDVFLFFYMVQFKQKNEVVKE